MTTIAKRPKDLAARYGGEEFALLLPETELEDALKLAEECRKKVIDLKIDFKSPEFKHIVTISLGVCTITPQSNDKPALLLKSADRALYKAKKSGRNRVEALRMNASEKISDS